jgi:hypothetical protein
MAEAGVDLLVVNSNNRSTHGHGNIRYLTDIATHFESSCCLVAGEGLGIDTMVAYLCKSVRIILDIAPSPCPSVQGEIFAP